MLISAKALYARSETPVSRGTHDTLMSYVTVEPNVIFMV
jgi:hypothetical protein